MPLYPFRYDFFLVSQSVRQGTVSPTSYNVIFDTSGLKPDHIQMLTYKLTHLYFNWQVRNILDSFVIVCFNIMHIHCTLLAIQTTDILKNYIDLCYPILLIWFFKEMFLSSSQGTIRVPAPCQYAHKLAFLQGQSLHREFSAHLSDKLFFL